MTTGIYVRKDEVKKVTDTLQRRIDKLSVLAHDSEPARRYCEGYEAALADMLTLLGIEDGGGEDEAALTLVAAGNMGGVKQ